MDRQLHPTTGDFVADDSGGFELVDVVENKISMSYLNKRGSWEGDPTLGHRFDELARATDTAENRRRLEDLARDAVQWLLDGGELEKVDVLAESLGDGEVAFQVDAYQPGNSRPLNVGPFLIPVGGG